MATHSRKEPPMVNRRMFSGSVEGPYLEVRFSSDEDAVTLEVRGDVDLFSEDTFRDCVLEACASGMDRVVIDLRRAGFIDSSFFSILAEGRRLAGEGGCDLSVRYGSERIPRLVGLAGARRLIDLDDGRASYPGFLCQTGGAVRAVSPGPP
ncbi:MAG: STAS domain-containing protein [Actinomycetota bacterium]